MSADPTPPSLEEFTNWIDRMFWQHAEQAEEKLFIAGPKFVWFMTRKFDPARPYKYRGNAHQRRAQRRYRARMWEIVGGFDWKKIEGEEKSSPPSKIVVA
jgi:hypothetical protein